ncbi:hypothetical protein LSTR_LSTR007876 [Laodelphax striatellus]|uniref:Annexin n=1 Tax=Laodelphax striatellus TaxID=195883 RepID=A0A482XQZ2_LAOST|nr:hypothetical protein LSTR_LSTR007876 [Laodelphax striatellus]
MNVSLLLAFCLISSLICCSWAEDGHDFTIQEKPCDPAADAENLKNFLQSQKSKDLLQLLTGRTNKQRQDIKKSYKAKFNQKLSSNLVEYFQNRTEMRLMMFVARLMYTNESILARNILFSLDVAHSDAFKKDWGYMSIIITTNGAQLKAIVDEYQRIFKRALKDDLNAKMRKESGKKFLASIIDAGVENGRPANGVQADQIEKYYDAVPTKGNNCAFDKNKDLYHLMTGFSFEHLKKFITNYKNDKGKEVIDQIDDHCGDGEVKEAYLRIIRFATDPYTYYATDLHDGFNDDKEHVLDGVDRILITRSEIDLRNVNKAYEAKFDHDIKHSIKYHYKEKLAGYGDALSMIMKGN